MSPKNIVYWLQGYLEGKDSLTIEQIMRIKNVLRVPHKPSREQAEKMVTALFPDLKGSDFTKAVDEYCV